MSKSIKALKRISTIIGSSEPIKEGINKIMKDLEELELHTKCSIGGKKNGKYR